MIGEIQENGTCGWTQGECGSSEESDLCVEVVCPDAEEPFCEGDAVVEPSVLTCDPGTGECVPSGEAVVWSCLDEGLACFEGQCMEEDNIPPCTVESCLEGHICTPSGCEYSPCLDLACGDTCLPVRLMNRASR